MNGASSEQLKCLEEPSFEFEASKEVAAKKTEKKPSYRVLEDPFEAAVPMPQANNSNSSAKKAPNYRVLEDPMTTAMYDPSTSSEAQSAAAAAGAALPASSSCPPASEVLEGAREKFDKFWGSRGPARNTGNDTTNEP